VVTSWKLTLKLLMLPTGAVNWTYWPPHFFSGELVGLEVVAHLLDFDDGRVGRFKSGRRGCCDGGDLGDT
jgi:hypothetical protein